MFDGLGAIVITFMVMSVISVIGIVMLYLSKSEKLKKGMFYFLSVWGLVVAYCNILSTSLLGMEGVLIAGGIGLLSVIALLMKLCLKKENTFQIARILVTVSVVAGMADCFMI